MDLILTKAGETIEEFQQFFSHISGVIQPSELQADVFTAQDDIAKFVGYDIIEEAIEHYLSEDFKKDTKDLEDEEKAAQILKDKLVEYIQFQVALMAYREFALNNDATHTKTGRVARMDKETDQFNAQVADRDDMALMRKIQKAIDRLIKFLDENKFAAWINSTVYKESRDLLIWNAELFHRYYNIEHSRRLFLLLVPMIRTVQQDYIAPILGTDRFNELLGRVKQGTVDGETSGSGSAGDESLLDLYDKACSPIAYLALAHGYSELPVQLFPETMSRQFWNAGNGIAFVTLRDKVVATLKDEGMRKLNVLGSYIDGLEAEEAGTDITDDSITDIVERNDSANKYFRV